MLKVSWQGYLVNHNRPLIPLGHLTKSSALGKHIIYGTVRQQQVWAKCLKV